VNHQYGATRWQRPGVHQKHAAVHLELAILHRLTLQHGVHHLPCSLHPEERGQVRQRLAGFIAEQAARGGIGSHDPAPLVRGDHTLDHRLDQRRRFGLLPPKLVEPVSQLLVHLTEGLHQSIDVGNAGTGETRRCPRGDGLRSGSDLDERPGDRTSGGCREDGPDYQGKQGRPGHCSLSPVHDIVYLVQARCHPHGPRATRNRYIEQEPANRLAPPSREPAASGQCCPNLGPAAVILDRR
jgi:hypothetical protein